MPATHCSGSGLLTLLACLALAPPLGATEGAPAPLENPGFEEGSIGEAPSVPSEVLAPPTGSPVRVVAWQHLGVQLSDRGIYRSERKAFEDWREVGAEEAEHPWPGAAPDKPEGFRPDGGDRATRLAGVALAWPVFQHFYPYFDVVTVLEGVPAPEAVRRMEAKVSGAKPASRRWHALVRLAGEGGAEMVLTVEKASGERRELTVPWVEGSELVPTEPRPEPVAEIAPGVRYLDLTRVGEEEQTAALVELADARGVIFDLRGYPRVSTNALTRLIDAPVTSAQWHVPVVTRPDREGMEFELSNWEVYPAEPRIRGKVAFLTDERAISYAETYLGIVEHYRLGEIVGAPTAGTNGNVNPMKLPDGFTVLWTGMKVLKHDGSRHHGVGILPTVPAERTIAGIRAGRDEVLERALEVVTPSP